jgi:hypothetical protein
VIIPQNGVGAHLSKKKGRKKLFAFVAPAGMLF